MEKKIMYTENAPDKKFLWLHTKNSNLVLEVFGNKGWESVSNETDNSEVLKIIKELSEKVDKLETIKQVPTKLIKIKEDCSKQEMISAIMSINKILINSGLVK